MPAQEKSATGSRSSSPGTRPPRARRATAAPPEGPPEGPPELTPLPSTTHGPAGPGAAWARTWPARWQRPSRLQFLIVAIAVALGVAVGAAAALGVARSQPTYQSNATLLIDEPRAIAASNDGGIVDKLGRLRAFYADVVGSDVFAAPVAAQVGLPLGVVRAALTVNVPTNSLVLVVGTRTNNPTTSRLLAQAAAEALVTYVQQEQTRNSIPDAQRVTMTVITPAGTAAQIAPTKRREIGVGAIAFAVIAGASLIVARVVRPQG